jgi:hypothetical protein
LEQFFNFLSSIFSLRARQGWILVLVSGSALVLNRYEIRPFNLFNENWIIAASIAFVGGLVILLVCFVEWLLTKSRENNTNYNFQQSQIDQDNAREREAVQNITLLDRTERTALAYIFSNGQKRFRGEARYNELASLANKQIIGQPISSTAHDIWIVRDSVWNLREDLLKKWTDIHVPNSPPWNLL